MKKLSEKYRTALVTGGTSGLGLAFCEMLGRDFHRLTQYQKLHEYSPLGAGALAGSTLHLDPEQTAQNLGFPSSFGNSYDVVGDRDFVLELLQI